MRALPTWEAKRTRWLALVAVAATIGAGCGQGHDTFLLLPLPVQLKDRLVTAIGDMKPTRGPRCGLAPDDSAPAGSGSAVLLIDTATPLSAFVTAEQVAPLPFRHGEVALYTRSPSGAEGALRVLVCDTNLVRTDLAPSEFRLDRGAATTGPLGGVIGGDLLGRFALGVRFAGTGADTRVSLSFTRSDIGTSCQLDDAVLPFRPLGGQLAVAVGDAVLTYPATRITVSACVEPLADPLRPGGELSCLDPGAVTAAQARLMEALASANQSSQDLSVIQKQLDALNQLSGEPSMCGADLVELGNVVEDQNLLRAPYQPSGVDMQFLVSTALPDLILSQTACERLADRDRCKCSGPTIKLRLPGLHQRDEDAEQACPIKLGSASRTALALVARQRYLSACSELARSRRQRSALPSLVLGPRGDCRSEACLINLQRESNMTSRRCGYSGPDPQYACDDHRSPVAAVVELGGPQYEPAAPPMAGPDLLDALVVPDTARVLQSANADIRSDGPQVDGVIGLSVLSRLATTIDYPQSRVVWSCRCGDEPGQVCRAYRGVTYNPADSCSQDSTLQIPSNYGRVFCR